MIDKPGCYHISSEEYHSKPTKEPALSRGVIADLVMYSPKKAWYNHPQLNPNYSPDYGEGKFDLGSAAHALLLEGEEKIAVIDAEDWRKKEAKEARDIARLSGKTPLLKKQFDEAKHMVLVAESQIYLCNQLQITNLRIDGDSELTYVWKEDDVWLKTRLDWISKKGSYPSLTTTGDDDNDIKRIKHRGLILDYKTTGVSANPQDVARTAIHSALDIQDALYRRGVKAVDGIDPWFVFMFQETEPPYECSFVDLPEMVKDMGMQKVENGINLWKECMKSGNWLGYPHRVVTIDTPGWAISDWNLRNQRIGVDED